MVQTLTTCIRSGVLRVLWALMGILGGAGLAWAAPIAVGVSPSPMSVPFYVAEQQGYFRSEGVDVALVECPTGSACLKQLLDAKLQLATVSDLPIMFRSFEHVPFKVLATFATSQDVKLIARAGSGIRTSKDLKGRHVGVVRGAAGQYVLELALLAAGVDPHTVPTADIDVKRLDLAVADARIEAFALFQPGAYQLLKRLGRDAVVLPVPSLYTLTFNLVVGSDRSGTSVEMYTRVLRALQRALDFIKADPAAAQALVRDRLKMDAADVSALWADYRFGLALNQSLVATLESTAHWALQEQLVKPAALPNYLDFIDVEPLRQVRPAAVTVVK